jgi:hypothetical protein
MDLSTHGMIPEYRGGSQFPEKRVLLLVLGTMTFQRAEERQFFEAQGKQELDRSRGRPPHSMKVWLSG